MCSDIIRNDASVELECFWFQEIHRNANCGKISVTAHSHEALEMMTAVLKRLYNCIEIFLKICHAISSASWAVLGTLLKKSN